MTSGGLRGASVVVLLDIQRTSHLEAIPESMQRAWFTLEEEQGE